MSFMHTARFIVKIYNFLKLWQKSNNKQIHELFFSWYFPYFHSEFWFIRSILSFQWEKLINRNTLPKRCSLSSIRFFFSSQRNKTFITFLCIDYYEWLILAIELKGNEYYLDDALNIEKIRGWHDEKSWSFTKKKKKKWKSMLTHS